MGKEQSKSASTSGDAHVNILNQIEENTERHNDHEIKLWILLAMNVAQIVYKVFRWHQKSIARKAFRKGCAQSSENIDKV